MSSSRYSKRANQGFEIEAAKAPGFMRELKRLLRFRASAAAALSRNKAGIRKLAQVKATWFPCPRPFSKELVLEFLGLEEEPIPESDLESAIINQIERFLLEMGKGFLRASEALHV